MLVPRFKALALPFGVVRATTKSPHAYDSTVYPVEIHIYNHSEDIYRCFFLTPI
ncbi:MAG: hypothetical protein K2K00_03280 [Muribaculaceae bacterium]|nr:hypothetical protein [Muribaculaceae bacterium]MDE6702682.1 hypothetical protein [Muribaculaceae bacterium]